MPCYEESGKIQRTGKGHELSGQRSAHDFPISVWSSGGNPSKIFPHTGSDAQVYGFLGMMVPPHWG
jgi:hypothetical protein